MSSHYFDPFDSDTGSSSEPDIEEQDWKAVNRIHQWQMHPPIDRDREAYNPAHGS